MGKRWIESPLLRFHAWNNMVITVVTLVSISSIEQSHVSQNGITLLAQDSNITAIIPFIPGRLNDLRHGIHAEFERNRGVDIFVGFDRRQVAMHDVHTGKIECVPGIFFGSLHPMPNNLLPHVLTVAPVMDKAIGVKDFVVAGSAGPKLDVSL